MTIILEYEQPLYCNRCGYIFTGLETMSEKSKHSDEKCTKDRYAVKKTEVELGITAEAAKE